MGRFIAESDRALSERRSGIKGYGTIIVLPKEMVSIKRIVSLWISGILTLLLAGCTGDLAESEIPAAPNAVVPTVSSDIRAASRGVYFPYDIYNGCEERLYFIDYDFVCTLNPKNGEKTIVCQKPGCTHKDETCDAVIGDIILPSEDKIYYFDTRGEQQKTVLGSCGLNGENRQDIIELWNGTTIELYESYLADGHIYCTRHTFNSAQIYDVDLSSNTLSVVVNAENEAGVFAHILDVIDGTLYYQVDYADQSLADKDDPAVLGFNHLGYPEWYQVYSTGTSIFRLEPGGEPELLKEKIMASSWSNGESRYVYYTSPDKRSIFQYDLTSGTERLAYAGEGPYEITPYTYDHIVMIRSKNKDEPMAKLFTLDLANGELQPVTVSVDGQEHEFFDLCRYATSSNYYIVAYRLNDHGAFQGSWELAIAPKEQFKNRSWDISDWVIIPNS